MMHWSCVEVLYMLSGGGSWLYSMMACFIVHQNLLSMFLRVCKPLQSLPPETVQVVGGRFIAEAVLPVQTHVGLAVYRTGPARNPASAGLATGSPLLLLMLGELLLVHMYQPEVYVYLCCSR